MPEAMLLSMRRFIEVASRKVRGGFLAAADTAVCHWVVPLLLLRKGDADKLSNVLAACRTRWICWVSAKEAGCLKERLKTRPGRAAFSRSEEQIILFSPAGRMPAVFCDFPKQAAWAEAKSGANRHTPIEDKMNGAIGQICHLIRSSRFFILILILHVNAIFGRRFWPCAWCEKPGIRLSEYYVVCLSF